MINLLYKPDLKLNLSRIYSSSDLIVKGFLLMLDGNSTIVKDTVKFENTGYISNKYIYTASINNLPTSGTYTLHISVSNKNGVEVQSENVDISVMEDSLSKKSSVYFDGRYLTNQELLEMATGVLKVPFPTKIDKNGNITYTLIEGKITPIVYSGQSLPLGSYATLYQDDGGVQRQVSIRGVFNMPVMTTDETGKPKGFNYNVDSLAEGVRSYILIVGVPTGKYYLRTWYNNKEVAPVVRFQIKDC